jgi:hypothetical protein
MCPLSRYSDVIAMKRRLRCFQQATEEIDLTGETLLKDEDRE